MIGQFEALQSIDTSTKVLATKMHTQLTDSRFPYRYNLGIGI